MGSGNPPGDGCPTVMSTRLADLGGRPVLQVPATIAAKGDPTAKWSAAQRAAVGVLRNRPRGTTAGQIAIAAGISEHRVKWSLKRLAKQGFVCLGKEKVPWGQEMLEVQLWRLDLTERCVRALAFLARCPDPGGSACPERVPPEFWPMFWSGARGSDARLPEDSLHVACTLLDCPDRVARAWALQHLPVEILKTCRAMRGYDQGEVASALDAAIDARERVGNG